MSASIVLWVKDIDREHNSLMGGKAVNLGLMMHQGLPVPGGFCVTTEAYRRFLVTHHLHREIADILGKIDFDNPNQLDTGSRKIRTLIDSAEVPVEIAENIKLAYIRLNQSPVAIRSSETAEDLPAASFAGQQESYLNVKSVLPHKNLPLSASSTSCLPLLSWSLLQDGSFAHQLWSRRRTRET